MRMLTKTLAALGFVGALAAGTPTASMAQGFYIAGPGFGFGVGAPYPYYRSYRHHRGPYAYYGGPYRAWGYERPYYRHYRHHRYHRW
jgi:hypothetical protein